MLTNRPFLLQNSNHPDQVCLLLHGLGGGVYEMEPLGQALYDHGYSAQGIAYPGHDRPYGKMPPSTWPEWFGHILATYQQLRQQYARITLVGFSTGCPLALELAAQYPVDRLVLMAPYMALRYQWFYVLPLEAYLYSVGYLIPDLPRLGLPICDRTMKAAAQSVKFFHTFNTESVRSAAALITQVKPKVPQIQAPSLVIQSRRDSVVAPEGAQWLYENLGSARKEILWLEHSDHIISLDQERDVVFQRILQFLDQT